MTSQRYAFFSSLSLLVIGCTLTQKHPSFSLEFAAASGLANHSQMNMTLTSLTQIVHQNVEADAKAAGALPTETMIDKPVNQPSETTLKTLKKPSNINTAYHTQTLPSKQPITAPDPATIKPQYSHMKSANSRISKNRQEPLKSAENTPLTNIEPQVAQIKKTLNESHNIQHSIEVKRPRFSTPPAQPRYPRLARKKGLEGIATLEVLFNQAGEQLSLTLVSSSGFNLLDKAALDAVKQWHFSAPDKQIAYAYKVRVPIRFSLN